MKLMNGNPQVLISIAVAGACTIAFSGCLPTPPTTLALFYQVAPTANEEPTWIKRWVPASGDTEVLLQQQADTNGLNVELLTDPQPSGAVISLVRYHPPSTSWSVLVADNPTPAPRLLYTQTAHDDGTITGGRWLDWSPDGKRVAMQINRTVWLSQADGVFRYPIGIAEVEDDYVETLHGWSQNSAKIAWTSEDPILDVYDANTGNRWNFSIKDDNASEEYRPRYTQGPFWFYGSTSLGMTLEMNGRQYHDIYELENAEPMLASSNASNTSAPSTAGSGEIQLASVGLSFAHNLPLYASVTDIGQDGDDDVVILQHNWPDEPITLLAFAGLGQVVDGTLSWSPDDSRLLVITTALTDGGEVTTTKVITIDPGTIDTLFEDADAPDVVGVIVDWSPNSRYVVQAYASDNDRFVHGILFDTQLPEPAETPLPDYRKIAWASDSSHLAVVTDEAEASECSVSVVKTSDSPRTVTQVAENTSCLAFWSVPGTP